MEINFIDKGNVHISDARIIFRKFNNEPDRFRNTNRSFHIIFPSQEAAEPLIEEGWPVKIKAPREEGEDPLIIMKVNVKMESSYPPNVYLDTGSNLTKLDGDTIDILDRVDIESCEMELRPKHYENRETGGDAISAVLNKLVVIQKVDWIIDKYAAKYAKNHPADEESPF